MIVIYYELEYQLIYLNLVYVKDPSKTYYFQNVTTSPSTFTISFDNPI